MRKEQLHKESAHKEAARKEAAKKEAVEPVIKNVTLPEVLTVKELADNTHFNAYGAYEVSKMIVMGLKQLNMPVVSRLRPDWQDYSPAAPDDVNTFQWFEAARYDNTKPDGN